MFQESEVIVLIIAVFALIFLINIFKNTKEMIVPRIIFLGFFMLVCSYTFTVMEDVLFNSLLNTLEHVSYLLSGLCFVTGFFLWKPKQIKEGEQIN